jgi:hypothetical protein
MCQTMDIIGRDPPRDGAAAAPIPRESPATPFPFFGAPISRGRLLISRADCQVVAGSRVQDCVDLRPAISGD